MSALHLLIDLELVEIVQRLQLRAHRILNFRSLVCSVPRPFPRSVFRPDPSYLDSDIANRAIVDLMQFFDLASGVKVLGDTIQRISTYRCHPLAKNLTVGLGHMVQANMPVTLTFPAESGEVMYVVTTGGEIIIAARSGHQRDLPHPTLIGGDDPEALSAGLVLFRDGRIVCVFINASGHFKPNDLSSIEVSLALFSRLPAEAFHPEFEGYQVFRHGGPLRIDGPIPTGGSGFNPFQIINGGDIRGTVEMTDALARRSQMVDAFHLIAQKTKKVVGGTLMASLQALNPDPVFFGLMTPAMRQDYGLLLQLMMVTAAVNRARTLGGNATYQKLVNDFLARLAQLL
ncbi:MAG: hypothetical protein NTV70_06025 [Acidobacteria bacterium]|nr:hypothetical protein [Acidobacteriota bacterium]